MIYGYVRGENHKDILKQQFKLTGAGCEEIIHDNLSLLERSTKLERLARETLKEGDTLVLFSFKNAGLASWQLIALISDLNKRNITLKTIEKSFTSESNEGQAIFSFCSLLLDIDSAIAEEAEASGATVNFKSGRPPKITPAVRDEVVSMKISGRYTIAQITNRLGISKKYMYTIVETITTKIDALHKEQKSVNEIASALEMSADIVKKVIEWKGEGKS